MQKYYISQGYLKELSKRAKAYRISAGMTQSDLADASGVSLRTIQYFENGRDIKLDSFIKLIMAMGLDANLEMLIPDVENSPIRLLEKEKRGQKSRQRVRKKRDNVDRGFKWGDEK